MRYTVLLALPLIFSVGASQGSSNLEDTQMPVDYCESLILDGLTKEEAYQLLEECKSEQNSHLEERLPATEVDCYDQVGIYVEQNILKDPSQYIDYDDLLDKCLNGDEI